AAGAGRGGAGSLGGARDGRRPVGEHPSRPPAGPGRRPRRERLDAAADLRIGGPRRGIGPPRVAWKSESGYWYGGGGARWVRGAGCRCRPCVGDGRVDHRADRRGGGSAPAMTGRRVLIAEDEATLAWVERFNLESEGYEVRVAS